MLLFNCLALIAIIDATVLELQSVKRGNPVFREIKCFGSLLGILAVYESLPPWNDITDMCAEGPTEPNLECRCRGPQLICGFSRSAVIRLLINDCFARCTCGDDTEKVRSEYITNVDPYLLLSGERNPVPSPFSDEGLIPQVHTCSGSCTSVNRGCAWAFAGDCSCHAPPVNFIFWFKGACETIFATATSSRHGKREISHNNKRQKSSSIGLYSSNFTNSSPNKTALLMDKLSEKDFHPAPCNASYVSYACHDSKDGIVHEPAENWLGALLPENVTVIPPVPQEWLKIHGFE